MEEALIPAAQLIGLPGISADRSVDAMTYVHFAFAQHQIVFAEGAPAESFLAAPLALDALPPATRRDYGRVFPVGASEPAQPSVPLCSRQIAKKIVARHARNQQPLLQCYERERCQLV